MGKTLKIVLAMVGVSLIIFGSICLIYIFKPFEAAPKGKLIYYIGEEYVFDNGSKVLVKQDFDEERFIYAYTAVEKIEKTIFYFRLDCYTMRSDRFSLKNSDEFIYLDENGNEIEFDKSGFYYYQGDKTIYISYKNASEKIKAAIQQGEFKISCGIGSVFNPRKNLYSVQ